LTLLQYVDDTIVCMEIDRDSIENIKFLLYCFENMSDLKINYHKNEIFVIGASAVERMEIASLLNCREGKLPFRYLGIPVSDKMLYTIELIEVGVKVEKRLPAWQGLYLSSGGKSVLIESSLSFLPNYTMGVYLLSDSIHQKMDSARANFFWNSSQQKQIPYGEMGSHGKTKVIWGVGLH
jgi:hypothetical protein